MVGDVLFRQINRDLRNMGSPEIVEGFITTNSTKEAIIQALQLAFEKSEIQIPDDAILIGELQSFEAQVLPQSGLTRYSAPSGGHDDLIISLASAWEGRRRCRGYYPTSIELQEARKAGRELTQTLMSGGGF
jgi:hypothetical protein